MAGRIAGILPDYPNLVAKINDAIAGYAYCSQYLPHVGRMPPRMAARSAGPSIPVFPPRRSIAAVMRHSWGSPCPNGASIALHEAMGFTPVGIYREVGRNFGRWLDVAWFQRPLRSLR